MVKNWIILGDAALDDADWALGVINFNGISQSDSEF